INRVYNKRRCYKCGKVGHLQKDCRHKSNDDDKSSSSNDNDNSTEAKPSRGRFRRKINMIELKEKPHRIGNISKDGTDCESKVNTDGSLTAEFLLDSGATDHFVGDDDLLSNPVPIEKIEVSGIDTTEGNPFYATKKGEIIVKSENDEEFVFEAFYVPGLTRNFFSLSSFGDAKN